MRVFVSFEDSTFVASSEQYTTVADLLRHVSTLPRAPPVALLRAVLTLEQRRTPLAPETRLDSLRNRSDVIVECIPATNSAEGEKTRGNALLAAGRASEACACYTAALAMPEATGPLRAALLLNRSLARAKLGEWRPAEQDARVVAEEDPENVKAWFRVGQALFGARKFDEAHEVLGRAIDLEGLQQAQAVEIGKLLQRCEKEHGAGLKGVSAEIISEARAAHLPVAAYVRLKPFYSMALTAMEQKKWAAAEETYRRILDVVNPEDYTSLFGLAAVLLTNKSHRYDEACRVLEKVCALHPEFGPWRMLGEAQLGVKQYDAAMASFAKAANFLSSGPSTQVQVERTKDLNVQISKTTLAQGKLDLALHYVSNVLKADDSDLRALIQYGHVLLKMGSDSEDELVKVALRVVAAQPKDRDVRRLFCTVLKVPGMVPKLLQMLHLVGGGKMGPSSFAFLASIAKEYSAVDAAIVLLRHAVELGGYASPTDVLSLVHVLEIDCRDNEALDVIRTWLEKNPEFSLGSLNAGRVLEAWKSPSPHKEPFVLRDDIGVKGKGKPDWTAAELDFLAMLFCLVKLLYLTRQFDNISSIVELIEPVRSQWELHLTTIRNEQAFYCCSVQCLESRPSVEDASRVVHVVGDSHCLPCAWQRTGDGQTTLKPHLVTGCKMWHLRPEGEFFPKHNWLRAMESIPSGADVMVVLGEIDCREGLLVCVEKGRYASLEEGIQVVISIFLQNVKSLAARKKFGKVYIHPVAPVLNPTRHIVETFNPIFEARVREAGAPFVWLDFVKNLVEPAAEGDAVQDCQSKNRLKSRYELDGTHLNPLYISENVFLN